MFPCICLQSCCSVVDLSLKCGSQPTASMAPHDSSPCPHILCLLWLRAVRVQVDVFEKLAPLVDEEGNIQASIGPRRFDSHHLDAA